MPDPKKTKAAMREGRRFCYYATRNDKYGGKPHVVIVTADEPGYNLVNPDTDLGGPWKDMEGAERGAAYWNAKIGVSDDERDAIVTSSMRCFDPAEAETRRAELRR